MNSSQGTFGSVKKFINANRTSLSRSKSTESQATGQGSFPWHPSEAGFKRREKVTAVWALGPSAFRDPGASEE